MRSPFNRRLGTLAAVGYLAVVAAIELARAGGGGPDVAALASSPSGVLSGHVSRLFTSGLIVAGDPIVQLSGAAVAVVAVLLVFGPRAFWQAAFAGHVLATLVAYAGVGVLWLVARPDVDAIVDAPDYGISCVWAGALGALAAGGIKSTGRPWVLIAAAAAAVVFFVSIPLSSDLAGAEHVLAFGLGGLVASRLPLRAAPAPSPA